MLKIAVNGISGRMGQAIFHLAKVKGHEVVAGFDIASSPYFGKDITELQLGEKKGVIINEINENDLTNSDGIIDFSAPAATMKVIEAAIKTNNALVIGTTGFNENEKMIIHEAAKKIPVLFAPNMSIGVNLLFKLTEIAAKSLPDGYDVEVFEAHHRFKKDSPSGTARRLIEILKKNILRLNKADEVHGREGIIGERKDNELGVQVLRGGDIVGEHTVFLVGKGERIELTHRAANRDNFAEGAVLGLEFIAGKEPGLYSMNDVLNL